MTLWLYILGGNLFRSVLNRWDPDAEVEGAADDEEEGPVSRRSTLPRLAIQDTFPARGSGVQSTEDSQGEIDVGPGWFRIVLKITHQAGIAYASIHSYMIPTIQHSAFL